MDATFEDGVLQIFPDETGVLAYESIMIGQTIFANGEIISVDQIQEIILHSGFTAIRGSLINSPIKKLYIPDGVIELDYSPHNCQYLEEISLPSSLQRLSASSLSQCPNLRRIEFRGGVNKDLKIGNNVFAYVFNIQNAESLFDLDTADEFKAYLYNKDFRPDTMKQKVLVSYLTGKQASGKFEQAILSFGKKKRDLVFDYLVNKNDSELLKAYLDIFLKGKNSLVELDYFLDRAAKMKAVDAEQVIAQVKKENFPNNEIKKSSDDTKLKKLGLKNLTVADYKRLYSLKETTRGYLITQYKGDSTDVIIPEQIGSRPVIAIQRGVFQGKNITSIESPIAPCLADFFGMKTFPKINVYGHIPLKKKARVKSLEEADVDQFVLFGHYPAEAEDGNLQPIIWRVIERENDELLLISRFHIENLPMHSRRETITWDQCDLRSWLNDLFYNFAFDDEEKQKIIKVNNTGMINPKYPKIKGKPTDDYVFLLCLTDPDNYISAFYKSEGTEYVNADRNHYWISWLSSNGRSKEYFSCYENRSINYTGEPCNTIGSINPVIRIKL